MRQRVSQSVCNDRRTFICTCAGFLGVAETWFATVSGRRSIAGAGADAITANHRTLITPFGPVAVQHRAVLIQRAPTLFGAVVG